MQLNIRHLNQNVYNWRNSSYSSLVGFGSKVGRDLSNGARYEKPILHQVKSGIQDYKISPI